MGVPNRTIISVLRETAFALGWRHGHENRNELTNGEIEALLDRFERPSGHREVTSYANGWIDGKRGDRFRLELEQARFTQAGVR